ncbi:MAG: DUF2063 domain-containing protein [Methylophilaceae bacterium]
MSQLAKLQADFQTYIFDNDKGVSFKKCIINDKKVGVTKRLGIYSDGYRLRIIEALANVYPNLKALLGDDLFDSTARAYIDDYPSTYRNMRWVGDHMCEHINITLPQYPIAAEMATFEWALGLAFDAEDAPVLTIQDLAAIPPEEWGSLYFEFHPSVNLIDLQWNVIPVWQALDNEKAPPTPKKINEPCLVWRSDLNSHYRSLDTLEYQAIQLITFGSSFGDLCESLYSTLEDAATQQAAQYLAGWIEAGIISKIEP